MNADVAPSIGAETLALAGEGFRIGQIVEYQSGGAWQRGVIADAFRGPVSGMIVYDIGERGYYASELRHVADDLAGLPGEQS